LIADRQERTIEVLDPAMVAILRDKSAAERLAISWGMWRSARAMLCNLQRVEHPDWSEDEVNRAVSRRLSHGAR
jgi:hypothetical protein